MRIRPYRTALLSFVAFLAMIFGGAMESSAAVGSVALQSPANGAVNVPPCVTLKWNAASGATGYYFEVWSGGVVVASGGSGGELFVDLELSESTVYQWRVRGRTSASNGPWSAFWSFTTKGPIPPPVLSSPANGASNFSMNVQLQWQIVTSATSYEYEVYYAGGLVASGFAPDTASPGVSLALFEGDFVWRVRGRTSCRNGFWSETWAFTIPPIAAPALVSPPNGAIDTGTTVGLVWQTVNGATGYDYEIWDGASVAVIGEGSPGVNVTVPPGAYTWRVRGKTSARVGAWSGMWSFDTRPPIGVPVLVSPANGADEISMLPTLQWQGAANATGYDYEVRQGTTVVASGGAGGLQVTLASPLSEDTTYQWRVRGKTSTRTGDWSGYFSFTTRGPIPAPALLSPANGAVEVGLQPTLKWAAAAGATGYNVELYRGTTLVESASVGGLEHPVASVLSEQTVYTWRVQGKTSVRTGAWGTSQFTTVVPLPVPALVSPASGAEGTGLTVSLSWQAVSGATGYDYQVMSGTTVVVSGAASPGVSVTVPAAGAYTWRVRGKTSLRTGAWSVEWAFDTRPPIDVPVLVSPANGADEISMLPTLQWQSAANATGYDYEVRQGTTVVASGSAGGLQVTLANPLTQDTTYTWRVRGKTSARDGKWSNAFSFTTRGPIPAPVLASPANGAVEVGLQPTLKWAAAAGATGYNVELYRGSTLVESASVGGLERLVSSVLSEQTVYTWRVQGKTSVRTGAWATNVFTTVVPMTAPVLVSPANGAFGTGLTVSLNWQAVSGATGYDYQVMSGATVVVSGEGGPGVSVTVPAAGGYTWRVRGKTSLRTGAWSAAWGFDTRPLIGVPVLVSPANGADEISMLPTLQWESAANATGYDYEVRQGTTVVASGSAGGLQVTLTNPLTQDTTYTWRVRGKTSARDGEWSASFSFTTRPPIPAPVLASPANGAVEVGLQPTLKWAAAAGATGYNVELYRGSTLVESASVGGLERPVTNVLAEQTAYTWRVQGKTSVRKGAWATNVFTTVVPLTAPALVSPTNWSVGTGQTVSLNWQSVSGATGYDYQVMSGATVVVSGSGSPGVSVTVPAAGSYTWRVRGKTSLRNGAWSAAWGFDTRTPVIVTVDNADGPSNVEIVGGWTASAGSTGYWGSDYLHDANTGKGAKTVTFIPTLGAAGNYEVLIWYTAAANRASNLPVDIIHAGGTTTATVNQRISGSQWVSLGSYNFQNGTTGRVRIRTTGTDGYVIADAIRWVPTSLPPIGVPVLVGPANGADEISMLPTLQWQSAANATGYDYEVRQGTTVVASGSAGGLQVTLANPLTQDTTYTWRVRGKTSARDGDWSNAFSFTTRGPIPAPVLASPANGAVEVGLQPTLKWTGAAGATGYNVELYRGSTLVESASVGGLERLVSSVLSEQTVYTWRVQGKTSVRTGAWATNVFTTVVPMTAPVLVSPANGAFGTGLTVSLNWQALSGATGYDYQVMSGATVVVSGEGGPGVSVTVPAAGAYTWRVRGKTSLRTGAWSAAWGFDTWPMIFGPVLVSPANGADEISMLPTLQWESAANATGYDYEVRQGTTVVASGSVGGLQVTLTNPLTQDTTYTWRVRGKTSARVGNWSASFSFTTRPPIPAPVLASPANGAVEVGLQPTLKWAAAAGATGYNVELYRGSTLVESASVGGLERPVTNVLAEQTAYTWRVQGKTSVRKGAWATNVFTTVVPLPAPVLVSPSNGAVGTGLTLSLNWQAVSGATGYDYQVMSGATVVVSGSGSPGVGVTVPAAGEYTWRVRGKTSLRNGAWSAAWGFDTRTSAIVTVDNADGSSKVEIVGGWTASAGSTGYWGIDYLHDGNTGKGAKTVTFIPTVGAPGSYEVFIWYTAAANRASNLPVDVIHAGGTTTQTVNQRINGSQWVSLGSYNFQSGTTGRVRIRTTGTDGYVIVDAIRLVPTSLQPIGVPTLASPANGAQEVSMLPTLQWQSAANATGYDYEVLLGATLVTSGSVGGLQVSLTSPLTQGTTYTWRARGKTSARDGDWSTPFSFTTRLPIPAPVLVSPANGAVGTGLTLSLSWQAASGATGYDYEVMSGATVVVHGSTGAPGMSVSVPAAGAYTWRVRGKTAVQAGLWSAAWGFDTGVPAVVTVDNSEGPAKVELVGDWTASAGSTGYWGSDYLHDGNTGKGAKTVTFIPTVGAAGRYEVFIWYTAAANRASNLPVDVVHAGVITTQIVNQRINGSQWVSLGAYYFDGGTSGRVRIRTTGTDGYAIADAIRLVPSAPALAGSVDSEITASRVALAGVAESAVLPRIVALRHEGQTATITVEAAAGVRYALEASHDLRVWQDVETLTSTGTSLRVVDSEAGQQEQRFYRIRIVDAAK
ncbi:MAG: hypothetical protein IT581_02090 [Verrucomicrobiales bacterium]|nr:hypothetical protein [Verrucomicrobiales bacterium]